MVAFTTAVHHYSQDLLNALMSSVQVNSRELFLFILELYIFRYQLSYYDICLKKGLYLINPIFLKVREVCRKVPPGIPVLKVELTFLVTLHAWRHCSALTPC